MLFIYFTFIQNLCAIMLGLGVLIVVKMIYLII